MMTNATSAAKKQTAVTVAQMDAAKFIAADKAVNVAAMACEPLPCTREHAPGENCIRKAHALKPDDEGRSAFWYGADCELPQQTFCSSCLAYWLIAVARNALLLAKREAEVR